MSENFDANHRCKILKKVIEEACVMLGLNLCVYGGKIGFVDQKQSKIVALWEPKFQSHEDEGNYE